MNSDKSPHEKTDGCCAIRVGSKVLATGMNLARAVSFVLLLVSLQAFAANEQTLGVLQVGDHTYHNVRVRTKAKDYIFIVHSSGMTSIKVTQLPVEVRAELGYATDTVPASIPTSLAHQSVAMVEQVKSQSYQAWDRTGLGSKLQQLGTYPTVVVVIAVLLMVHLFCSYCCMLICQKTGNNPGLLVWLPLLQAVPMLRAASMSIWWLGALFIPALNLLAWVVWCLRIVEARRKTIPLAILLLFPLTSWLAFLFLAFSEDSRDKGTKVHVEAVSLQSVLTSVKRSGATTFLRRERHIVA
ncbi:MAG TPA: hypothetical protein VL361_03360 [Candidatus Limnocylindrales bacterium]|jgi:hypothetical protein|nr:hypothetical protein [Candidatus Limnocylindrales bacterium]